MNPKQQEREEALFVLQRAKKTYGPAYEACLSQAEYRSAAWKVVELNMPLLHWTLRPLSRHKNYDDLAGELILTLFKCCYNWEPSFGKFSTYAVASMRFETPRAASELRQLDMPMRLPAYLQTESGRDSYMREIGERTGALKESYTTAEEQEMLDRWWGHADAINRSISALEMAKGLSRRPAVRTQRFRDEDGIIYGDAQKVELLEDEDGPSVENEVIQGRGLRDALEHGLATLPERERRIIEMRFGIDSEKNESKTMKEVGQEFGVTRERIRQVEKRALRKLRYPKLTQFYSDFIFTK